MGKGMKLLVAAVVFTVLFGCAAALADGSHTHWARCDQIKDGYVCEECGKEVSANEINIFHYGCEDGQYEYDQINHWYTCQGCGKKMRSTHWAYCDATDVCAECGAKNVKIDYISHHFGSMEHDSKSHWMICDKCGMKDISSHWAFCDAPDVCAACGAKDVVIESVSHSYDWDHQNYDDRYHWRVCVKCGDVSDRYTHRASCDAPDVCAECGAKNVKIERIEHDTEWDEVQHDSNSHWWICKACGEKVDQYMHWAYCDQPDVCAVCGAKDVLMEYVSHEYDWEKAEYDDLTHWWICSKCGQEVDRYEHWAYCGSPDVCASCGAKNVTMQRISHRYDWDPQYNSVSHWFICKDCGETIDQGPHWANCDQPDVCAVCGAKDVAISHVSHTYNWSAAEHDGDTHWWICIKCGQKVDEEWHRASCENPGVCIVCGAENVKISYTSHDFNWNDPKYDKNTHWWICATCGEKVGLDVHWAYCDAPNVCAECGAKDVTIEYVSHGRIGNDIAYDKESHWWTCPRCGEKQEGKHWAFCTSPTMCADCGAKDVTMLYIEHSFGPTDVQYDQETHWFVCRNCGEKADQSEHWAFCSEPTVCAECGAKDVTMEFISHDTERQNDSEYHWWTCKVCGAEMGKSVHIVYCTKPGVCGVCGIPFEGEIYHVNNNLDEYTVYDETYHQFECQNGHGLVLEKHDFVDGVCRLCGYGKAAAPKGDANGDGSVDGRDVIRLAKYIAGQGVAIDETAADLNGDGNIDGRDLLRLAKQLAGK